MVYVLIRAIRFKILDVDHANWLAAIGNEDRIHARLLEESRSVIQHSISFHSDRSFEREVADIFLQHISSFFLDLSAEVAISEYTNEATIFLHYCYSTETIFSHLHDSIHQWSVSSNCRVCVADRIFYFHSHKACVLDELIRTKSGEVIFSQHLHEFPWYSDRVNTDIESITNVLNRTYR